MDISISALQLEHLMLGKKLEGRVAKAIFDASLAPRSSQAQAQHLKAQTCSYAGDRLFFRVKVTPTRTPGSFRSLCDGFEQQAFTGSMDESEGLR